MTSLVLLCPLRRDDRLEFSLGLRYANLIVFSYDLLITHHPPYSPDFLLSVYVSVICCLLCTW